MAGRLARRQPRAAADPSGQPPGAQQPVLFEGLVPVEREKSPGEKLSYQRRLTIRQHDAIERGRHPLTGETVQTDPAKTCGSCAHRFHTAGHSRDYPKCNARSGTFITHGPATDVRAWWPGCPHWTAK